MTQRQPICDEIAADAAGFMSLPPRAPERVRAEEHARGHAPCARALDEGRQLLALIEGKPMSAPPPAALERASAPIIRDFTVAPRFAAIVAASVLAAWALPLAMMRAPVTPGMDLWVSIALAALAAVTAAFVIMRAGIGGVPFVLLSILVALAPGASGGLEPMLGLHCALTEVLTAVGVGAAAFVAARALGRQAGDKRMLMAALAGGALAGHAALQIGCSAAHAVPHLLAFHTGPVSLAVEAALVMSAAMARRAARI